MLYVFHYILTSLLELGSPNMEDEILNATRLKRSEPCNASNSLCCISIAWEGWSGLSN